MFLSIIKLNLSKRETLIALSNPQRFHGAVSKIFYGKENERPLWRVDSYKGNYDFLLLSREIPNLICFVNQFGIEDDLGSVTTKDYFPFLNGIANGQTWSFRLTANTVITKNGHCVPVVGTENQISWLSDKSKNKGFDIDLISFCKTEKSLFQKGGGSDKKSFLSATTFDGILTVNKKDTFVDTLINGIGHGKAYGMGLITLVSYTK